ncbi:MAG: hypothetical protein A4E49_02269 [Methanosaeta sp. PtaU1.Bin112]|nr:MAG: hypothetical protein A4E49_02269 [Methanosaeta sp. PtaU1.Bin112]
MKWMALAVFMLLLLGIAQSGIAQDYPLQMSNGVVNCTIFGSFKDPGFTGTAYSDSYSVLVVDSRLSRLNESDKEAIRAVYSLTDGNDRVFQASPQNIKELQPGRRLIGFVVPKETIAKSLTIDLSSDRNGGEQFSLRFPELVNISNENVTLLYYGVLRSSVTSYKKTIELDVAISNNGTKKLVIEANNFTLKDQWGWEYMSREYDNYIKKGMSETVLVQNETIRSNLIFNSVSPLSRPVELIYRYSNSSYLTMNIDFEGGLLSAEPENVCTDCESPEDSASSLAGSIKATKARLAKVKKLNSTSESAPKGRDEL